MATTPDGDGDTLAQLSARYASAAGESLEEAAAKERRAELEERAATWALLEVRGCRAAHAVPRCSDSCVSTNEGWLGEPAGCPEGDAAEVGLRLASALEALGRRGAAIAALARASVRDPSCARVRLARAKLLFRSGDKPGADAELAPLLDAARQGLCGAELVSASAVGVASDSAAGAAKNGVDSDPRPPLRLDPRTAGDAFYIAGWVRIHADDHTAGADESICDLYSALRDSRPLPCVQPTASGARARRSCLLMRAWPGRLARRVRGEDGNATHWTAWLRLPRS